MTTFFVDTKNGKDSNTGLGFDQAFLTYERLDKALDESAKEREKQRHRETRIFNIQKGTSSTMVEDDLYGDSK